MTADELRADAAPDRIDGIEFTAAELDALLGISNFTRWYKVHEPALWESRTAHVGSMKRAVPVYRRKRA